MAAASRSSGWSRLSEKEGTGANKSQQSKKMYVSESGDNGEYGGGRMSAREEGNRAGQ